MSNPLGVPLEFQKERFWCWAAVAKGVADFYANGDCGMAQCDIATRVLHIGDCCNGAACNRWSEMEEPLVVVQHTNGQPIDCSEGTDGVFAVIQNAIKLQQPIPARIQWSDGTGHFVVICGCSTNGQSSQSLQILDPWDSSTPVGDAPTITTVPFDVFFANYQGHGTCTTLYLTA
jgi:hypothetical protein